MGLDVTRSRTRRWPGRDSTPATAGVEIERRFRAGEEEYPDRHGRTSGEMVVSR
jgi:hypothetical protein